jgi:protein phosphatase
VRKTNQDAFLLAPEDGFALVADGMGGARAGEIASQMAVEAAAAHLREASPAAPPDPDVVREAFERANQSVLDAAARNPELEGMGTTLIGAVQMVDGELLILSVGDSRAYLCQNGSLKPLTEDQSWVNEVGRRIGMAEEQLKTHRMRHVLTMAVGVNDKLRINQYRYPLRPDELVLLCSDGLHGVVGEPRIKELLDAHAGSLEAQCEALIQAAREAGGPDNITAVLLRKS